MSFLCARVLFLAARLTGLCRLWNFAIGYATPYLVNSGAGNANLGVKVFFIWGSTCAGCFVFTYFCVPETKGLSLEQVDRMLEETTPRTSAKWVPHDTFAQGEKSEKEAVEHV